MALRENESFTAAAAKLHIRSRIQDVAMESLDSMERRRHAERRTAAAKSPLLSKVAFIHRKDRESPYLRQGMLTILSVPSFHVFHKGHNLSFVGYYGELYSL